jgi:hypothetical protein
MKPPVERVQVEREELEQLLEHARPGLSEEEYRKLKAALDTLVYLTQLVENKNTTIARLRQILFGASTEKTAEVLKAMGAVTAAESVPPSPAEIPTWPHLRRDTAATARKPTRGPSRSRSSIPL